jgi:hypothetical protein
MRVWIYGLLLAGFVPTGVVADGRVIYRCEIDGLVTFSDRPCSPAATIYQPDSMNTYEAPPSLPASREQPAPRIPKKDVPPAADLAKHKQTCERLAQDLKYIRSKLRAGYKASEGEKLKARQERVKSQLRMARCN